MLAMSSKMVNERAAKVTAIGEAILDAGGRTISDHRMVVARLMHEPQTLSRRNARPRVAYNVGKALSNPGLKEDFQREVRQHADFQQVCQSHWGGDQAMAKVQAIFHEAAARVFGRVAHRRRTLPGYANTKVKGALKEWRKAQAAVHGLTESALRKAQARKKVAKKNWLAAKGDGL